VFQRNSLNNKGLRLDATVHFGVGYDNAMWDGRQMIFGDGDGVLFQRFTVCLDVIAHELTHGVTAYTSNLEYYKQSGALNESFSDVFGSLVKQWVLNQDAATADWLIGAGLLTAAVRGRALRSMLEPGTAYDDPYMGRDPQPGHMQYYVETEEDSGGVHVNSGIPNRAFALAARAIGGKSWEGAGNCIRRRSFRTRPTCRFRSPERCLGSGPPSSAPWPTPGIRSASAWVSRLHAGRKQRQRRSRPPRRQDRCSNGRP
jgi:Zn-dependent metalloprotease